MEVRIMASEKKVREHPGQISLLGTASTMGLHMVSGPVVGAGLGWLVDEWLGSWPVGAAVGLLLGLAAGFRNVWEDARYLARINAEQDEGKKAGKTDGLGNGGGARSVLRREEAGAALAPDIMQEPTEAERKRDDDMVASLLAGTADPGEKDLQELDETLEAVRRVMRDEGGIGNSPEGKGHEHH